MPVISATWEDEIWRTMIQGQLGQKVSETPPNSTNKLSMVVHNYDLRYAGGVDTRILAQGQSRQKAQALI
jgi:hypothetical protein